MKPPLFIQLLLKVLVSSENTDICYLFLKCPLGRDKEKVKHIKQYLQAVGMFRDFSDSSQDPDFAQVWEHLSLNTFPLPQACGFNCGSFS